jgi:glycerol-3-phosphate acyltransferase PlsY
MNTPLATLGVIAGAYLLGSVSFAVVVSKLLGLPDPHSYGSGNPGATNVLRTGNKTAAALTLAGDGLKGWLAVWLAHNLASNWGDASLATAGAALAVFAGHLYPVFHRFAGGKGVSTAAGIDRAVVATQARAMASGW